MIENYELGLTEQSSRGLLWVQFQTLLGSTEENLSQVGGIFRIWRMNRDHYIATFGVNTDDDHHGNIKTYNIPGLHNDSP